MNNNLVENDKASASVKIIKDHISELSVRNLDDGWICERKVSLDSVMFDDFIPAGDMKLSGKVADYQDY